MVLGTAPALMKSLISGRGVFTQSGSSPDQRHVLRSLATQHQRVGHQVCFICSHRPTLSRTVASKSALGHDGWVQPDTAFPH